ncbi:hypothetical protein DMENIID0001_076670 [Sergentomyia squamirostris]
MWMYWVIVQIVVAVHLCRAFHMAAKSSRGPSAANGDSTGRRPLQETTHYTGNLMTIGLDSVSIDAAGINKRGNQH